jgi:oligo-alginate lyase
MHCAALYLLIATFAFDPADITHSRPGAVFLTSREAAAARERFTGGGEYAETGSQLLKQADALVAETLDIPREGGQWPHWYSCPEDGGRLRAQSPTAHVCPVCGKTYSGWPYDQVYITFRHSHWLRGIETLGWAYTLDPKPAYAERAREILLSYAQFYRDLPIHDKDRKKRQHGARLYAQTLDESVTLCAMMIGYDRVYHADCFSKADHAAIAGGLVRPMVETIDRNRAGRSNWQTWHNAGIACAGFVLKDTEYVDRATNAPGNGLLYQLTEGSVLDSGMWYEGAPSYHWYALTAIVYQLEAAARAGMNLYSLPQVQKLFDGPMRLVFPDLTFPAINDSSRSSIHGARRFYEIAWKRYGVPRYIPLLEPRDTPWALFWGGRPLPEDTPDTLPLETSNDTADGLAILRDNSGETALYLDYSPAGSGHVQPAKLGIILYAHGDERFVDPGRLPYGNPLHRGWYTTTLAHNTVVMNQTAQRRCAGELVRFEQGGGYALVRAKTGKAWPGTILDRTLILAGNLIFDVFHCTAEEEAVFDLPLHLRGKIADAETRRCEAAPGTENGYQHLRNVQILEGGATLETGAGKSININLYSPGTRFLAEGYGSTPREILPCIIQRQKGTDVWFSQAYELAPDNVPAYTHTVLPDGRAFSMDGGLRFRVLAGGAVHAGNTSP